MKRIEKISVIFNISNHDKISQIHGFKPAWSYLDQNPMDKEWGRVDVDLEESVCQIRFIGI
jgi:hypothetical protein